MSPPAPPQDRCPVCQWHAIVNKRHISPEVAVECARCGSFHLSQEAYEDMPHRQKSLDDYCRSIASHKIRRMQGYPNQIHKKHDRFASAVIDDDRVGNLFHGNLPDPQEQADNLILYVGNQCKRLPGPLRRIDLNTVGSMLGSSSREDVFYIITELVQDGQLHVAELRKSIPEHRVRLTFKGWERFHELTRAKVDSRRAFMAMPFGNELVRRAYRECFQPAVTQTGFRLETVDEQPQAGSIPDRIRVEVRRARFAVADLTDANSGAYWEAGFAEGLGRPVIYTCNRTYFDKCGIHFDTKHLHTIMWDENDFGAAAKQLKDTIRATLPEEASLEDVDETA